MLCCSFLLGSSSDISEGDLNVWYCVCTVFRSNLNFFFLLKLSVVCTFWIVLMC
jgi:hypothetical protein